MTMSTDSDSSPVSRRMLWAGYVMSALPVLMLLFSASMKLLRLPAAVEGFAHLGYPDYVALPLGIVELTCTILYVIPNTSVLGAILLTGYFGGATATHVRVGEPFFAAIVLGTLVWGGLYLRDKRLRTLIPLRI
jgi:hypothetical protein